MSDHDALSPLALLEKLISGTLDNDEASRLLDLFDQSEELLDDARKIVMTDAWLGAMLSSNRKFARSESSDSTQSIKLPEEESKVPELDFIAPCIDTERDLGQTIYFAPPEPESGWSLLPRHWTFSVGRARQAKESFSERSSSSRPLADSPTSKRTRTWSELFFVARLILFVAIISWLTFEGWRVSSRQDEFRAVATVVEVIDPVWEMSSTIFKRGQILGPGQFVLREGTVKLRYESGVELILEAPFDFTLGNENTAYCKTGKISAFVPPEGTGFEVTTDCGKIIDRGTAFMLETRRVNGNSQAILEVVQGHVDLLHTYWREPRPMTAGMGVEFDISPEPREYRFTKSSFLDKISFETRLFDFVERRKNEKKSRDKILDSSPGLLARFEFDGASNRSVQNTSRTGQDRISQATVYGGRTCEGEMLHETALHLKGHDSEVRMNVSGEYADMTLLATVRIDSLSNVGNVLFSSDSYVDSRKGSFLWQILRDGSVQIQLVSEEFQAANRFNSARVFSPRDYGTWIDLAVVFNSRQQRIVFYADGKKITDCQWSSPVVLVPGESRLGNITLKNISRSKRDFDGALHRFLVFDRALSEKEVSKL